MKFASISSVAAFVALLGTTFAQTDGFDSITVPAKDQALKAGETLDITWEYNAAYEGTVTLELLQGATPSTLEIGETIACMFFFFGPDKVGMN